MPAKKTVRLFSPFSLFGVKWAAYLDRMTTVLDQKFPTVRFKVLTGNQTELDGHLDAPATDIALALTGISTLPRLAAAGKLVRLDEILATEQVAAYRETGLEACSVNRTLYGIPKYLEIITLFQHPAMLRQYGMDTPRTWRHVMDDARHIVASGNRDGIICSLGGQFHYLVLDYLWSRGHAGDPAETMAGDAGLEALHFVQELFSTPRLMNFKLLSRDAFGRFKDGAAPFILHTTDAYAMDPRRPDADIRYAVPDGTGTRTFISPLTGLALCVPHNTENPGFALRVLDEFLDFDRASAIHDELGFTWGCNAYKKFRTGRPDLEELLADIDTRGWPLPRSMTFYRALETMNRELWSLVNRHASPEQVHENIKQALKDAAGNERTGSPVRKAIAFIDANYHKRISITNLPEQCGISYRQLNRLFRIATGRSPKEYLLDLRVKKAQRLLAETRLPVGEIALRTGYGDPYVFSKMFRKRTGVSPTAYRVRISECGMRSPFPVTPLQ